MAKKKSKKSELQSSFLNTGVAEDSIPELEPVEMETVVEYLDYPKVILNPHSLYCPDCNNRVQIRLDGTTICPNCITKVPVKVVRIKKVAL